MSLLQHAPLLGIVDFGVWDALRDVLLLLFVALLFRTIAERLRQSVIVGYLIAGTVVGPNVLSWISKQQEIFYIAELGLAWSFRHGVFWNSARGRLAASYSRSPHSRRRFGPMCGL